MRATSGLRRQIPADAAAALSAINFGKPLSEAAPSSGIVKALRPLVGSLDAPALVPPVQEVGIEGRLPWMTAAALAGLPQRKTAEDDPEGVLRGRVSYQHPDHDTPDGWAPPKD